jgi:hypothetical protein
MTLVVHETFILPAHSLAFPAGKYDGRKVIIHYSLFIVDCL